MTNPDDLKQLAPTGTLRGGVVVAPAASAFFCIKDAAGAVHGVTVDLLRAFAATLQLPLDLQVFSNSGQVTDAVAGATCDLAFMPRDAEREKKVDFGPAYYVIDSTYLVPAGSAIQTIDEVNRPGLRIVAIANTTTMRSARRTAPLAGVEEVAGVDLMTEMARDRAGRRLRAVGGIPSPACCPSCRARACCPAISSRPAFRSPCPRAVRRRSSSRASCCKRPSDPARCAARSMPRASRTRRSRPSAAAPAASRARAAPRRRPPSTRSAPRPAPPSAPGRSHSRRRPRSCARRSRSPAPRTGCR